MIDPVSLPKTGGVPPILLLGSTGAGKVSAVNAMNDALGGLPIKLSGDDLYDPWKIKVHQFESSFPRLRFFDSGFIDEPALTERLVHSLRDGAAYPKPYAAERQAVIDFDHTAKRFAQHFTRA